MEQSKDRKVYNKRLGEEDDFFKKFSALDNETYQANVLDKRQKELIGLTISIMSRCKECILYHLEECQKADVTRDEVMEVVKMTVIGGGSVLYPFARKVLKLLDELKYE
ncbi:carboxymuconolactone decarboxylase family protein [Enterococcus avium]|uniref:carboxymuconolactone decarboxylase family protein n=1 Tax=Enterococcus avium TaxID=33945 RepID=UPI00288EF956|nr:carboxymuconolactone decarboxylase family protein [Enterococcus avium]MDT2380921.1 carboxymuconolactone decarboxylase family protein [Enterococcus avium]MDT2385237.1 carboxymuconolactone decarboxylase family protein [Enterococcus avium]MDT2496544.1 carboxymuconolactone decarboxylase family protein [Enterococcus avium]